jgi:hypothetical protein
MRARPQLCMRARTLVLVRACAFTHVLRCVLRARMSTRAVLCAVCASQRKMSLSSGLSSSSRICSASSRADSWRTWTCCCGAATEDCAGCKVVRETDRAGRGSASTCCSSFDHDTDLRWPFFAPRLLGCCCCFDVDVGAAGRATPAEGGGVEHRESDEWSLQSSSADVASEEVRLTLSSVLRAVTSSRYLREMGGGGGVL